MIVFQPSDAAQVAAIVSDAAGAGRMLEIIGGGSKRAFGHPSRAEHQLDLTKLDGIIDYDPAELVLTAQAATPMAVIETALAHNNQMLAFEPPDWRNLLQSLSQPTLGGILACNMAGPRRVRAGAARDHFLGFAAVNGRGELWKAGGKVVKNVTGYDLCKVQAGAFGTLSVLSEVTIRVVPRPDVSISIALGGLSDAEAIATMAAALNWPHEVSAAAHLPAKVRGGQGALTVLRLEGHGPSVAFRAKAALALLPGAHQLGEATSIAFWREIAEVGPLTSAPDAIIWRLCPTPSAAPELVDEIAGAIPAAKAFYDWGGGLVWLSLPQGLADGGAAIVRTAMRSAGGHATMVRAPEALRDRVAVFEVLPAALAALSARVKASFDPAGILNSGRMQRGM